MKTFKHKNLILIFSFFSAIFLSFGVISPVVAGVGQGIDTHANCVNTTFPDNVERDIVINPDAGLIYVGYEENGVKKETTLNLKGDVKFSECANGARELIALAKKNSDKIDSDTCKELEGISLGAQSISERMNIAAANNYISKYCK